jgi:hypothetical protein
MAIASGIFKAAGGVAQDLFSQQSLRTRAKGQRMEAEQYDLAAGYAREQKLYTRQSTELKQFQTERNILKTIGGQKADVAAAGFGAGGTALDLLRDSASQGALEKAVFSFQGAVDETAFEQQAKSYEFMAKASRMSADESDKGAENINATMGLSIIGNLFSGVK